MKKTLLFGIIAFAISLNSNAQNFRVKIDGDILTCNSIKVKNNSEGLILMGCTKFGVSYVENGTTSNGTMGKVTLIYAVRRNFYIGETRATLTKTAGVTSLRITSPCKLYFKGGKGPDVTSKSILDALEVGTYETGKYVYCRQFDVDY